MMGTENQAPLITREEEQTIDDLGRLAGQISRIMGDEVTEDMREAVFHIHALQNMILSQAARRAYPKEYRMLGRLPNWGQVTKA